MVNFNNIVEKAIVSKAVLSQPRVPVAYAPKPKEWTFIKTMGPFDLAIPGRVIYFHRPIRQKTKQAASYGVYSTSDPKEADAIWEVATKTNQYIFEKEGDSTEQIYGSTNKQRHGQENSQLHEQERDSVRGGLQESAPGRPEEINRGNQQGQQPEGLPELLGRGEVST